MPFETIIGLEVHLQLKMTSKMFCRCSANIWKAKPNSHTCPVCLGLPGALPTVNQKAIEQVITAGLALNCRISRKTYFERKNYFYPDLPKGYQISQYRAPLCVGGRLTIPQFNNLTIGITRAHLEEDTAKSAHIAGTTLLDFNKSGIPLLEIVSEPEIHSVEEAKAYSKAIQGLVRRLGVSDADMEKGQMRLEANISLRDRKAQGLLVGKAGAKRKPDLPNYRVEIKNINSFRFLEKALAYEIERQTKALKAGEKLIQETRGFNEKRGVTFSQREKEHAHDYRYFPEPDIPPLEIKGRDIAKLRAGLPELPDAQRKRFIKNYNLPERHAELLVETKRRADYFEALVREGLKPQKAANITINRPGLEKPTTPQALVKKIKKEKEGTISDKVRLLELARGVVGDNPQAVLDFKQGKKEALQFLVGKVMRETKGRADAKMATEALCELLKT